MKLFKKNNHHQEVGIIYDRLLAACGPRGWWPGETRDEIIIGAVLTQNTAWRNVEKALANLKAAELCRLGALAPMEPSEIAPHIKPSGYFNLKARRLKSVAEFFAPAGIERFDDLAEMHDEEIREALLGVYGVGRETADSILLYALDRLTFVIDAYTMRLLVRHGFLPEGASYEDARRFFSERVEPDLQIYNEYHALIVWAGHHYCKPTPLCAECPLAARECFAGEHAWKRLARARRQKTVAPSARMPQTDAR